MIGLVFIAMTFAGCGGSSSSSMTPHTHTSVEGTEDKMIEFLTYIRDNKATEIKNLLDSQSFTYVTSKNGDENILKEYNELDELAEKMPEWQRQGYKFNLDIKRDSENEYDIIREAHGNSLGFGLHAYQGNQGN